MTSDSNRPPNILIFLVDQMPRDVVCAGHPCHMPNAMRLAEGGVAFSQTYAPSPHCCPARATFLTGLYPTRHGVFNNVDTNTAFQHGLNPGVRLFSEGLRAAGYELAYAGKWHVSHEETPADRGWLELSAYQRRRMSRTNADWDKAPERPSSPERQPGEIARPGWGPASAIGKRLEGPDAYARAPYYQSAIEPALKAIPDLAKLGRPWALCVSTDMGLPSPAPAELIDLYDPNAIELPASYADWMHDKPRVYQRMRRQIWAQLSEDEVRQSIAHYWALCSLQDRYLGDLLSALDATGQADDTLVLFIADHGDYLFAHGLRCLGIPAFREVYHVPAIVRWPRGIVEPGREVDAFVSLADFAPTFLELAGCAPEQRLTGRSLLPFLRGERPPDWPDAWHGQSNGNEVYYTQRIVQTKRWKYVCNWFDFDELYDVAADPHEMTNLAFPADLDQPTAPNGPAPWPPLPAHLQDVRRDMLARMWRFARQEEDTIFSGYPPVALAPYGPFIRLDHDGCPSTH